MAREFLSDEQVDREIERLEVSPEVLLSKQEQRIRNRRRQYMYNLRWHEKRGKQLMEQGITYGDLKRMDVEIEGESDE